jgi:hypothetical protein
LPSTLGGSISGTVIANDQILCGNVKPTSLPIWLWPALVVIALVVVALVVVSSVQLYTQQRELQSIGSIIT